MRPTFTIDTAKQFPRLRNAPIVEAVIQWMATPSHAFDQTDLQNNLNERFPGFTGQAQREIHAEAEFGDLQESVGFRHQSKWAGFGSYRRTRNLSVSSS